MAQTCLLCRTASAESTEWAGITAYPAWASTALRIGANILSLEMESTAGLIDFLMPSPNTQYPEVRLFRVFAGWSMNASKKTSNDDERFSIITGGV
jgi:hypothetical protein